MRIFKLRHGQTVLWEFLVRFNFTRSSASIGWNHILFGNYCISAHALLTSSPRCMVLRNMKSETRVRKAFLSTLLEPVLVQAHDPSRVASELENAIDDCRFDDAWRTYEKHVHMDGFPRKSVLSKLVTGFAESGQPSWLQKCYLVVEQVMEQKKHHLLESEPLIYLSFILARCRLPILALNILRKLIQLEVFPPVAAWSSVAGHMCQTEIGAFLAAELVMEIGYLFKDNRIDPRKKINRQLLMMKPNSFVFSIVLNGCLLFGTTKKAEELLELMPRVGVKPDGGLLILMARIYEKNGHRDEVKNLKRHVEECCVISDLELQQFYDCLLSCHLKFGDVDSVASMVLEMLRRGQQAKQSLDAARTVLEAVENGRVYLPPLKNKHEISDPGQNFSQVNHTPLKYVTFYKDKKFLSLESEAKVCLQLLSEKVLKQVELVKSEYGVVLPTEKLYVKLTKEFLGADKISELADFLVKVSKEDSPVSVESSAVSQVIHACISIGLLDQAHDLLDEMRFRGVRTGSSVYSSLLKAYCVENRHLEVTALLKEARQAGIQLDTSCYETLIQCRVHHSDTGGALQLYREMTASNISRSSSKELGRSVDTCIEGDETSIMAMLLEEIKSEKKENYGVHDWNSVIHFFCKKRLMHDAQTALKKMRSLGHAPNAQTFHSLVTAYAAIGGKYAEVTELWGEMKIRARSRSMKFDQELLDSLLYCFVRGGFFLRALEIIEMMERGKMFIDKYKYRSLWLKYHRTLYKGKAPKVQTEAQANKREAALSFKRWIGLT